MSAVLKFTNWETHQHYKDRDPPWIKLHVSILSSTAWVKLSNEGRVLAIASMVIASKNKGQFEADRDYFKRVAYLDFEPDFQSLVDCGLCEIIKADQRRDREEERRGEESIVLAGASKMLADASTGTHAHQWKPLTDSASTSECLKFLMSGHVLFYKMSFPAQCQVSSLLDQYTAIERATACNRLIQDYAGDAEMKYAPARQLRYALEDVRNPRQQAAGSKYDGIEVMQ